MLGTLHIPVNILLFSSFLELLLFFFFALRSFKKKLVRNAAIGKFKSEIVKAAEKPLIQCIIDALFNIY